MILKKKEKQKIGWARVSQKTQRYNTFSPPKKTFSYLFFSNVHFAYTQRYTFINGKMTHLLELYTVKYVNGKTI